MANCCIPSKVQFTHLLVHFTILNKENPRTKISIKPIFLGLKNVLRFPSQYNFIPDSYVIFLSQILFSLVDVNNKQHIKTNTLLLIIQFITLLRI